MISSPDWDQDGFYELNVNCIWTVKVDVNNVIRFQVLHVEIQFTYGCIAADYLEVKNHVTGTPFPYPNVSVLIKFSQKYNIIEVFLP